MHSSYFSLKCQGGQVLGRFSRTNRETGSVLCSFVVVQLSVKPQRSI